MTTKEKLIKELFGDVVSVEATQMTIVVKYLFISDKMLFIPMSVSSDAFNRECIDVTYYVADYEPVLKKDFGKYAPKIKELMEILKEENLTAIMPKNQ